MSPLDNSANNDNNDDGPLGPTPTSIKYLEIYEGSDGLTHFRDITIDLTISNFAPPAQPVGVGGFQPAAHTLFTAVGANWGLADYQAGRSHPTPKREFFAVVAGEVTLIATDGERRDVRRGDVFLASDVAPSKGNFAIVGHEPAEFFVTQLQ